VSLPRPLPTIIMFKCMPFLCNRHVEYVNKSNCNLTSVPDEVLRHASTLEELLLDNNQIRDLPKVVKLRTLFEVFIITNRLGEQPLRTKTY